MLAYEYAHNPQLFNATKLGRDQKYAQENGIPMKKTNAAFGSMSLTKAGETVAKNANPTSHWGSTYKAVVKEVEEGEKIKSRRPLWSINRQAYSSSRGNYTSEFADAIGNFGKNPRDDLPGDSTKQGNKNNQLTVGTTKVTTHIPGYNGFLPSADMNDNALSQAALAKNRETIIKQNIVENQCIKIPGYKGHKPMSVINDRGSMRPTCLGTAGESFN